MRTTQTNTHAQTHIIKHTGRGKGCRQSEDLTLGPVLTVVVTRENLTVLSEIPRAKKVNNSMLFLYNDKCIDYHHNLHEQF